MRQLKKVVSTNDFLSFNIPVGKWKSFILQYSGTAVGGQTVLITDNGNVRLIVNSKQFQNISIERLSYYNTLKGGAVTSVSGAGAAYDFQVELPQQIPGDLINCLSVESDGEVVLELRNFSEVARIATGTVGVFGIEIEGIQSYYFKIDMQDFTSTTGTNIQDVKGIENVYAIFLENDTTNLDKVIMSGDGLNPQICNADRSTLVNRTNLYNQIETYSASLAFLEVVLAESKQLSETLTDSIQIQTEMSTGAVLNMFITSIDFAPVKEVATAAVLSQKVSAKLSEKNNMGKVRASRVLA